MGRLGLVAVARTLRAPGPGRWAPRAAAPKRTSDALAIHARDRPSARLPPYWTGDGTLATLWAGLGFGEQDRPARATRNRSNMRLGVTVPATGSLPDGGALIDVGSAAEVAGADGLWVTDHALTAVEGTHSHRASSYEERSDPVYDAMACCAYLAAATLGCRVGTACLVLPQHELIPLAKAAASLDRMSAGRLVLGVGAGWDPKEMEALGYDFATREARLDEMLQVLRDCWNGRPAPRRGEHVRVPAGVVLSPVPVAAPAGPPLILVGGGEDVLRRAVDLGDGWLAVADVAALQPTALAASISLARALHHDSGRSGPFEVVVKLHHAQGQERQLADAARLVQQAGADEVIVDIPWEQLDTSTARLNALASAIRG